MARKRRIDYPGAWHHVMHRGARREAIYDDQQDCVLFLNPEQAVWSSYAVYIGETTPPEWLCTEVILSLYGDGQNLVEHMQSLHRGSLPWPSDFDLQRGIFTAWDPEVPRTRSERAAARRESC